MFLNQEFIDLLHNLQSEDNDIRNNAETTYENINSKSRLEMLLQLLSSPEEDESIRIFAGVLCRRLLDNSYDESFRCLPVETQNFTKQKLLEWLINDNQPQIRKKICEIIVEIAQEQFDDNGNLQWTELLSVIFDGCLNSLDNNLKVTGLQMFAAIPNLLGDRLHSNINLISQIFSKTMSELDENTGGSLAIGVRVASVKSFASFICSRIDENTLFPQLSPLIPLMLKTTADSITIDTDDESCMKALVDISDTSFMFLKPRINDVLELCLNILHNANIDNSQKHLAVEVFVSLTENCPGAVRKYPNHMKAFIQILFKMLTELEDDPEWATMDTEDDEDESSPSIVAEMSLDRISCAMRGRKVLSEITLTVPAMLHSPKWQERHGGLMAISSCAEGLNKVMEEILGSIIDEIVPLLSDEHPRVRYAACNAVGQLSTDFSHKLQKAHHSKILPALLKVLDDDLFPRVQAYGGAAMVNFCESAPKWVVVHYLPVLAEKLLIVLRNKFNELSETGRKLVLEQIVTTIAAVADSVAEEFAPYYSGFMEFLKFLMQQCDASEDLRLLRGKTIECISLMGLAVGRDRFMPDAQDVMQLLLQSQSLTDKAHDETAGTADGGGVPSDDPQHSYMISAWARMCKLLGKSFAEFLPLVMRSVLRTASIKPDVCMMYNDEAEDIDKDWQVVKIADDQNFAIHTSGLEDKATACQMLVCYARELTDAFSPYVDAVADIMIPLLKFYFNEEVRSSAADIMPLLLDCAVPLGGEARHALWVRIADALLAAIPQEPYKPQIADMLDAVAECIRRMGRPALDRNRIELLVVIMRQQFEELDKAGRERSERRRSDEYDPEDEDQIETEQEHDDGVLGKLVDVMHALFLVYRDEALPVFDQLLEHVTALQAPERCWTDLQYCVCFWDDLIESVSGDASWRYCQHFLPVMIAGLRHSKKEVRQGAIYGFGVMAMYGGPNYRDVLREVAPLLVELIEGTEGARDEDLNMVTENAISSLTKICVHQSDCVPGGDVNQFVHSWLRWLPVWEDTEETPHVFGFLCHLVETGHVVVNNSTLPGIIRSIAICFHKDGLAEDDPVYARCVGLLRMLQANGDCLVACINECSKEEQGALHKAMNNPHLAGYGAGEWH